MDSSQDKTQGKTTVQEFTLRFPPAKKLYDLNCMSFNANLNVNLTSTTKARMEHEDNSEMYKRPREDAPKYGAGSEYGREAREEARRKRFGIRKNYKPENQPWILKCGDEGNRKHYKSMKGSGINDYTQHYIFASAPDGAIEMCPINEWHNFKTLGLFKTLTAEEAEETFSQRNKIHNYFSLMANKKARGKADEEDTQSSAAESGKKGPKKGKGLKITDMEEWMDSDDDSSNDEGERNNSSDDDSYKKKNKKSAGKKKQNASDDEAFEESDDGDEEGREREYISDSSESETELDVENQIKSVAEEEALKTLLISDDEDEEAEEEQDMDKEDEEENYYKDNNVDKYKIKKEQSNMPQVSDSDSGISEGKGDTKSVPRQSATITKKEPAVAVSNKRKLCESLATSQAKQQKLYNVNIATSSRISKASQTGVTEEAVRKYLARKPITTSELVKTFKGKKTGLSSDELVKALTEILLKIKPKKEIIRSKVYWSMPMP